MLAQLVRAASGLHMPRTRTNVDHNLEWLVKRLRDLTVRLLAAFTKFWFLVRLSVIFQQNRLGI